MLVLQQVNFNCDICPNISASNTHDSNRTSLFNITEGDLNTIITCYHCHGEMASIPHTMQIVRSQKKKYSQEKAKTAPPSGYFNAQEMDDKPYRYNSKKMNAIWGMYNKDSVHNFKSMACDGVAAAEIQPAAQGSDMLLDSQDMYQQQQQFQQQDFQQQDHGDAALSFDSSHAHDGFMGEGNYQEMSSGRKRSMFSGSSYLGAPIVGSPGQFTGMMPVGGWNNQAYQDYYTPNSLVGSSDGSNSS